VRRVSWAQQARRDVDEIKDHWIDERPDYVGEVLAGTQAALRLLIETPGLGSPVGLRDYRRWRIGRTPYLIFYRFDRRELRVLRVRHERQNWRKNL
jgi:plasmid stabilization system protein ParE